MPLLPTLRPSKSSDPRRSDYHQRTLVPTTTALRWDLQVPTLVDRTKFLHDSHHTLQASSETSIRLCLDKYDDIADKNNYYSIKHMIIHNIKKEGKKNKPTPMYNFNPLTLTSIAPFSLTTTTGTIFAAKNHRQVRTDGKRALP